MTTAIESRLLTVVVCAAGPAGRVGDLVQRARQDAWEVDVIATPAGLEFLDVPALAADGIDVRIQPRPRDPTERRPKPEAATFIVAPATFNTINKMASGICDNYALTLVAEAIGRNARTVVVPFVNSALAGRPPFVQSVANLRSEGVVVLLGEEFDWTPHQPGGGSENLEFFPWAAALQHATGAQEAKG